MQYIFPVLLSCFTGWFVIWLTIKMLFRPHSPVIIAGLKLQGILPANQQRVAQKIGKLVSDELLSGNSLEQKITDPENFTRLRPEIEMHIDSFLRVRLKETFPMLSMLIGDKTINQLKGAFLTELEGLFPVIMKKYINNLQENFELEKQVYDKIAGFSVAKTEELVYNLAKRQMFKLQLLGAGIGLISGLFHLFINYLCFG